MLNTFLCLLLDSQLGSFGKLRLFFLVRNRFKIPLRSWKISPNLNYFENTWKKSFFSNFIFILLSFFCFVVTWPHILDSECYCQFASKTEKELGCEMA